MDPRTPPRVTWMRTGSVTFATRNCTVGRFDAGRVARSHPYDEVDAADTQGLTTGPDGRIWLATDAGVVRTGAPRIVVRSHALPRDSLASTQVFGVAAAAGVVWALTRAGVTKGVPGGEAVRWDREQLLEDPMVPGTAWFLSGLAGAGVARLVVGPAADR